MGELEDPSQWAPPGTWIDEILRQFAMHTEICEQRYSELKAMMGDIGIRMAIVEGRQADLDNRLSTVQRLFTEQRHDVTKEESLVHLGIAKGYTILVTQRLLHLARQLVEENRPDRSLEIAQAVARLCLLLFGSRPAQTRAVLASLGLAKDHPLAVSVDQITNATLQLRQQADRTPDRTTWEFAVMPNSQLHDGQQAWGKCDPSHPVRFVVAPAYRVNGRIFSPQLVYTAIQPLDLGDSAAIGSRMRRLFGQLPSR